MKWSFSSLTLHLKPELWKCFSDFSVLRVLVSDEARAIPQLWKQIWETFEWFSPPLAFSSIKVWVLNEFWSWQSTLSSFYFLISLLGFGQVSSQNYSKVQIARPPTLTILDQASTLHFFTEYFFVRCFFLIFVRFWFETYTFTWQSPLMKKAHWKNWKKLFNILFSFHSDKQSKFQSWHCVDGQITSPWLGLKSVPGSFVHFMPQPICNRSNLWTYSDFSFVLI